MTTATPATTALAEPRAATTLRRLHAVRAAFALVWAVLLVLTASTAGVAAAVLLVLYPVGDAAAAVVDARRGRAGRAGGSVGVLVVNVVISLAAAVGLAVALSSGVPAVLRVWGAWAVVAGLVQLAVALRRRHLGGQWAMIVSGSLSVLAGVAFVLTAPAASLIGVAGYALLGGLFFLVSALRLGVAGRGGRPGA